MGGKGEVTKGTDRVKKLVLHAIADIAAYSLHCADADVAL
jgi:hypothetical protein